MGCVSTSMGSVPQYKGADENDLNHNVCVAAIGLCPTTIRTYVTLSIRSRVAWVIGAIRTLLSYGCIGGSFCMRAICGPRSFRCSSCRRRA
eukprot:7349203-Pyramimonas_sp.AAC.1